MNITLSDKQKSELLKKRDEKRQFRRMVDTVKIGILKKLPLKK